MPDTERLRTLINRITPMTLANKVPWTETSDERTFQTQLGNYNVTIAQEYAGQNYGEDVYVYAIRIHDTLGKVLDTAVERDFPHGFTFAEGRQATEALGYLHDLARRKALKVDEALDDLLNSLGR
jgi:hypothetical protein